MHRLRARYSVCKYLRNCTVLFLALALLSSFAVFAENGNTINGSSPGGKTPNPNNHRPMDKAAPVPRFLRERV